MIMECLNPQDKPYAKHVYIITIGHHSSFHGVVFADCLSDAIDTIIDHWQEKEGDNPGYFLSGEDLQDSDFSEEDYICGGNNCRVTSFFNDELSVEEFRAEDVKLLAQIEK